MSYDILKDFKGSPDGCFAVQYLAGTTAELTDSLAAVAVAEGWAKPAASSSASADAGGEAPPPAQAAGRKRKVAG
jgi:hypothetical protein